MASGILKKFALLCLISGIAFGQSSLPINGISIPKDGRLLIGEDGLSATDTIFHLEGDLRGNNLKFGNKPYFNLGGDYFKGDTLYTEDRFVEAVKVVGGGLLEIYGSFIFGTQASFLKGVFNNIVFENGRLRVDGRKLAVENLIFANSPSSINFNFEETNQVKYTSADNKLSLHQGGSEKAFVDFDANDTSSVELSGSTNVYSVKASESKYIVDYTEVGGSYTDLPASGFVVGDHEFKSIVKFEINIPQHSRIVSQKIFLGQETVFEDGDGSTFSVSARIVKADILDWGWNNFSYNFYSYSDGYPWVPSASLWEEYSAHTSNLIGEATWSGVGGTGGVSKYFDGKEIQTVLENGTYYVIFYQTPSRTPSTGWEKYIVSSSSYFPEIEIEYEEPVMETGQVVISTVLNSADSVRGFGYEFTTTCLQNWFGIGRGGCVYNIRFSLAKVTVDEIPIGANVTSGSIGFSGGTAYGSFTFKARRILNSDFDWGESNGSYKSKNPDVNWSAMDLESGIPHTSSDDTVPIMEGNWDQNFPTGQTRNLIDGHGIDGNGEFYFVFYTVTPRDTPTGSAMVVFSSSQSYPTLTLTLNYEAPASVSASSHTGFTGHAVSQDVVDHAAPHWGPGRSVWEHIGMMPVMFNGNLRFTPYFIRKD